MIYLLIIADFVYLYSFLIINFIDIVKIFKIWNIGKVIQSIEWFFARIEIVYTIFAQRVDRLVEATESSFWNAKIILII